MFGHDPFSFAHNGGGSGAGGRYHLHDECYYFPSYFQSPYHDATTSTAGVAMGVASMGVSSSTPAAQASAHAQQTWDVKDFLDSDEMAPPNAAAGKDGKGKSAGGGNKRVRKSTANLVVPAGEEDQYDGASVRKGRKSSLVNTNASTSAENKRRDSIKTGLEDLQRMLPHVGKPEDERVRFPMKCKKAYF